MILFLLNWNSWILTIICIFNLLFIVCIFAIFFNRFGFIYFLRRNFGRTGLNIDLCNLQLPHHFLKIIFGVWSLFCKTWFLNITSFLSLNYFKVCKFIVRKLRSLESSLLALLARNLIIIEYFLAFLSVHHRGYVKLTYHFLIFVWAYKVLNFGVADRCFKSLVYFSVQIIFLWFKRFFKASAI